MSRSYEAVRNEALELSTEERSWLAEELIISTRSEEELAIHREWIAEAERRLAELEAGTADTIPVDETITRARAAVKNAGRNSRRG